MAAKSKVDVNAVRRACINDLIFFAKTVLPGTFTLPTPDFHRQLAERVMNEEYDRNNIVAPRGFAKTTIAVIAGALWHMFCSELFHGRPRRPRFVVIISKSRPHSINLLGTIKNCLEHSEAFKALFGYHGQANAKIWREDMIQLDTGDIVVCRGMRQPIRGLNILGIRPTYIVADDAEDEDNTKTSESMENNLRWFLQAVVPLGGEGLYKVLNIGTPQHQRAMVMTLKDMGGWETLHFRALEKDRETGEMVSLWPEMRSVEWLLETKKNLESIGRSSVFSKEYMCEVTGDEDQLFKDEYLQYFTGVLEYRNGRHYLIRSDVKNDGGEPEVLPVTVFAGVDPASSVSVNADYTCICVIAVDRDGNRYVIEMIRERMSPIGVARKIIAIYKKHHPIKTQIETVGYQSMLSDYIRKEAGVHIPGANIKNNPRNNKTERLEGLQPLFYDMQVYLCDNEDQRPAMSAFRDELLMFPRGKHDDAMDAFWYANKGAYRPSHDKEQYESGPRKSRARRRYDWMVD